MISSKNYADALYEMCQNKKQEECEECIKKTLLFIEKKRHASLIPYIIKNLSKREEKEKEKETVHITFVKKEEGSKEVIKEIYATHSIPEDAREKIYEDKNILGGYVMRYKGIFFDASYKKKLITLYHTLST
jgi:F0F1-type ATP synthase delta subunit